MGRRGLDGVQRGHEVRSVRACRRAVRVLAAVVLGASRWAMRALADCRLARALRPSPRSLLRQGMIAIICMVRRSGGLPGRLDPAARRARPHEAFPNARVDKSCFSTARSCRLGSRCATAANRPRPTAHPVESNAGAAATGPWVGPVASFRAMPQSHRPALAVSGSLRHLHVCRRVPARHRLDLVGRSVLTFSDRVTLCLRRGRVGLSTHSLGVGRLRAATDSLGALSWVPIGLVSGRAPGIRVPWETWRAGSCWWATLWSRPKTEG